MTRISFHRSAGQEGQNNNTHAAKPLSGRRILITRPCSQAQSFVRCVEKLGGEVVEFPTIEIVPPRSYDSLDRAIRRIDSYGWIIFTSANGVRFFLERMNYLKQDFNCLTAINFAAIGPETAKELERHQLKPQVVPDEYRAEAILHEMNPLELQGKHVLLPRAAEAREVLPETLRRWGALVDVVEAYRAIPIKSEVSWLRQELRGRKVDAVTFTSSSTVKGFVALWKPRDIPDLMAGVRVACIGPITKKTAEELGLFVDIVAREYTVAGLTRAIAEYFTSEKGKR